MNYNIISQLISIESKKETKNDPLYKITFNKVKESILNGSIPYKTQLPSSRELAKDLHGIDLASIFIRFIGS